MKRFAVYLPEWTHERWVWLLDFTLAGLSFEHSFDLIIGEAVQAMLDCGSPDATRVQKQIAALQHHGLNAIHVQAHDQTMDGYTHVFRF
ncbi:hypothetical protein C7S18_11505 [Ahniella affigens]|uniref:Uncharacterized protein n=1 Tax=Ahniella affigens TaxID=2021234 RepID=A0A2P1PSH7_9GAMM|nr:hypothetical protein [Ahniella affigens]AVP97785.1 hypothetical protein C7S18_11505 [Ahniella affigens]